MTTPPVPTTRFDRSARWQLIIMGALLVLAFSSTVYRLSLPTDGWLINDDTLTLMENRLGAPSGLQPGDRIVAVEGVDLTAQPSDALAPLRATWRAGSTVTYTVERSGESVAIAVPLVARSTSGLMGSPDRPFIASMAGALTLLFVGLFTIWRRPDVPAARALWVLGAAVPYGFVAAAVGGIPVTDSVFGLTTLVKLLFALIFTVLWPPAMIRLALVFPRPKPIVLRHRWIPLVPFIVGAAGIPPFLNGAYLFGFVWTALSTLTAFVLLVHNAMTMRDAVSRAQLRWGVGGMAAGLALFFVYYIGLLLKVSPATEILLRAFSELSFPVMGLTLGIAVLRYRLYDIDVIIRKTLQYTVVSALLALVYFGSVVLLQTLFDTVIGDSPLLVVLSTLLIVVLFNPVRRRVQDAVDRRFYRRKYDAQQVLAQFGAFCRDETELTALQTRLENVVRETMQPAHVSVWLKEEA